MDEELRNDMHRVLEEAKRRESNDHRIQLVITRSVELHQHQMQTTQALQRANQQLKARLQNVSKERNDIQKELDKEKEITKRYEALMAEFGEKIRNFNNPGTLHESVFEVTHQYDEMWGILRTKIDKAL